MILSYGSEACEKTTEETNALRMFERMIAGKIQELVKDDELCRIRTN
jgi:hypothetical protein